MAEAHDAPRSSEASFESQTLLRDFLASLYSKYSWLKEFSSELSTASTHQDDIFTRPPLSHSVRNLDEAAMKIEADINIARRALDYLERQ